MQLPHLICEQCLAPVVVLYFLKHLHRDPAVENQFDSLKKLEEHATRAGMKTVVKLMIHNLGWQQYREDVKLLEIQNSPDTVYLLIDYRSKLRKSKSRNGIGFSKFSQCH